MRALPIAMVLVATSLAMLVVGCSSSSAMPMGDANVVPDARQYCIDRETNACDRDFAAARTSRGEYDGCTAGIAGECVAFGWPVGCRPLQSVLDACIDALSDPDRLDTLTPMLPECSNSMLCMH